MYELPDSFSRDDLKKLRESKEKIMEDTQKYAAEHENDEKYVTYNAQFEEREREAQEAQEAKNGKNKKKAKNAKEENSSDKGSHKGK